MKRRVTVVFRGQPEEIEATIKNLGPTTCEVEWRFAEWSPEWRESLKISAAEEEQIINAILKDYVPGEDTLGDEVT